MDFAVTGRASGLFRYKLYNIPKKFRNGYPSEADLPTGILPKLTASSGLLHKSRWELKSSILRNVVF